MDEQKLQAWISKLLRDKGVDIFRMKGFLSIAGESNRFVFQGVHMIFSGKPDRPWGSLPRRNQLVFIGRNLDIEGILRTVLYEYNGNTTPKILRSGWKAYVNDYAISGGWNFNGEALIICDAAGGIYVFDGTSGKMKWSQGQVHEGGILSTPSIN